MRVSARRVPLAMMMLALGAGRISAQTNCTVYDFEDGTLQGFTAQPVTGTQLWHVENNVCGAEDPGHSTPHTLYYGQTFDVCNYSTGEANSAYLVSPAISLGGLDAVTLDFNYRLAVESDPAYDMVFVDVSPDGSNWTQVLGKENLSNDNAWHPLGQFPVDGTLGGASEGYVRFRFDSVDGKFNGTLGLHVDDIVLCGAPQSSVLEVPTASRLGLILLGLAVAAAALVVLRRG